MIMLKERTHGYPRDFQGTESFEVVEKGFTKLAPSFTRNVYEAGFHKPFLADFNLLTYVQPCGHPGHRVKTSQHAQVSTASFLLIVPTYR